MEGSAAEPARVAGRDTLHLSLILSGAISLGAYEAGVVSQIAYALQNWNAGRETPLAVVDVIAGASAGAMTGAMLAAHIMRGTDARQFVQLNHDQWCGVTFDRLLDRNRFAPHALLSSQCIDDPTVGARRFYDELVVSERVAPPCQAELVFTCTLMSVNPIPFEVAINVDPANGAGSAFLMGRTYRDYITFALGADDPTPVELPPGATRHENGRPSDWDTLISAALASGSVQFAFQPMAMSRTNRDYPPPRKDLSGCERMRYLDGGLLNNLPLQRATDALEGLESPTPPEENRLYVLIEVDPDASLQPANKLPSEPAKRDPGVPVSRVAGAVYRAMSEQSFYMDVLEAQKVNRRLEVRRAFLPQLVVDAVLSLKDEDVVERIDDATKTLQGYLSSRLSGRTVDSVIDEYEKEHCDDQGVELPKEIRDSPPRWRLFLLQLALADYVANLHDKCVMTFLRIHPADSSKLAGEILGHFGGFMDTQFLHHDFACGLSDAFARLAALAEARHWPAPAEVLADMPGLRSPDEVDTMAALPYPQLPVDKRNHLKDLAAARAATYLSSELRAPWYARWLIAWALRIAKRYMP